MKFLDKVALITGGSSGIGLAVAKNMAEEGAKIVLASRSEKKGKAGPIGDRNKHSGLKTSKYWFESNTQLYPL